jgi:hypothetical protein
LRHRQSPVGLAAAVAALAAVALILAACGDVSLYTAFDAERAPAIQLVPDGQRLLAGTALVLRADGGTLPYQFSLAAGSGSLLPEDTSVTYTAPPTFPGEALSASVRVTDFLGETALASVTVFKPLAIRPESFMIEEGQARTLAISGGTPPYGITATGGTVREVDAHTWEFTAPALSGSYTVQVEDADGTAREVPVTVVGTGALIVDPPSALVYVDGTVSFQIRGGNLDYHLALVGPGSIDTAVGTTDPTNVVYTAPSAVGGAILEVTDAGGAGATVAAAVTVIDFLSATYNGDPASNKVKIFDNQTVVVVASGGLLPYNFAIVASTVDPAAASQGSILANASHTATYTPPVVEAKEWETIRVDDDAGNTLFQLVEIKPAP